MWDFLKGEKGGKISMMRFSHFIVVISVMGTFIAHNIVAMVQGKGFISLGAEEAMLLALTFGAKATQHFSEVKNGKSKTPVVTNDLPSDKGQ